jgi:branched-chain amino acid transport system substrate-binding protein
MILAGWPVGSETGRPDQGGHFMPARLGRRLIAGSFAVALGFAFAVSAQAQQSIKIGYAISKTGPYTPGAAITLLSAYKVWIKDVNDAGGIMLSSVGRKVPIEIVEYDDQSNSEELIKALERLANQDKVDFLFPPWGTAFSLASGPIFNRYGYPQLLVTATTDQQAALVRRWPNSFWFLGNGTDIGTEVGVQLGKLKSAGKINGNVAMISVADQFGIELANSSKEAFKKAGLNVVYDKSYPPPTQDMQPLLTEAMRSNADVFLAASYPPDTFLITGQAITLNYNPKVFFVSVGTAFPAFKGRFGANAEGVMGTGGWNADSPRLKQYLAHHIAVTGGEPDRWANPITYASLQMLQQAIERVGKVDRAATIKELQTGEFDTIIGKIKFKDNQARASFYVGQWQGGEYYGVGPSELAGAREVVFPKPAWKK